MKTYLVVFLLAGFVVNAAFSPAANAVPRNENSIWVGSYGSISNWRPVARDELILWNGPSHAYLVKVWRPHAGALRSSEAIGISRTAGRITKFDSVFVHGQKLPIKFIQKIDPQVAKAMRYRRR